MSISKQKNTIEKELLIKSHSKERTDEILEERYSIIGKQTPWLSMAGTQGTAAENKQRQEKLRLKRKNKNKTKFHVKTARTALKTYLSDIRSGHESLSYDDCLDMHQLWKSYINDLLSGATERKITAGKLATADYHGARLKVIKARNPSLVGLDGIVIWEARTSFAIITESSSLKYVDKKGTIFRIEGTSVNYELDIVGSRFLYRTAERSGRKFKTHAVDDI